MAKGKSGDSKLVRSIGAKSKEAARKICFAYGITDRKSRQQIHLIVHTALCEIAHESLDRAKEIYSL